MMALPMPASAASVITSSSSGHEHVEPFDREARLAREAAVEEPLEDLDVGQPFEQRPRSIGSAGARNRPRSTASRSHSRSSGTKMCARS